MLAPLIQMRRGERIRPTEYTPAHVAQLNARLNAIAAEADDEHTVEASA